MVSNGEWGQKQWRRTYYPTFGASMKTANLAEKSNRGGGPLTPSGIGVPDAWLPSGFIVAAAASNSDFGRHIVKFKSCLN